MYYSVIISTSWTQKSGPLTHLHLAYEGLCSLLGPVVLWRERKNEAVTLMTGARLLGREQQLLATSRKFRRKYYAG